MSEYKALEEAQGKLSALQKKAADAIAEAGPGLDFSKVTVFDGDVKSKVEQFQAIDAEMNDLGKQIEGMESVKSLASKVSAREEVKELAVEAKMSVGQAVFAKNLHVLKERSAELNVEVKALFETVGGWTPESTRTGKFVDQVTRPIQVTDLFPLGTTGQQNVVYMEETGYVNAAFETAEAGEYPDAALGVVERDTPVRKITVSLGVTDEQLADEAGARSYIDQRLPFMVQQHLDSQLLVGTGTSSGGGPTQLKGLLNHTGLQTQAQGAAPENSFDALLKAITKVRVVARSSPNAIVLHSSDWQDMQLARVEEGYYLLGGPASTAEPRIWGLPVAQTEILTAGNAIVGDFATHSQLFIRKGLEVQITNSHSDDFLHGKQRLRADMRVALAVYRPAAFVKVTGIA